MDSGGIGERTDLPTEPGIYWAKVLNDVCYSAIVEVDGVSPFFTCKLHYLKGRPPLQEGSNVADLIEFGPRITLNGEKDDAEAPIRSLGFNARIMHCLTAPQWSDQKPVQTIKQLCQLTPDELMDRRNFGRKSLNVVRKSLKGMGLTLKGDWWEE